jgi:hypothetical protein
MAQHPRGMELHFSDACRISSACVMISVGLALLDVVTVTVLDEKHTS